MNFIEQIKHSLWNWDSWECILMKIIKGKLIFIMLFLTNVDSKIVDICLAWAPYSDYAFSVKVFFKSDTAVALRRSVSKVPYIIVVSIINGYYAYFCELMWLSAKSLHVLELLNITRQCKMRFLDININFIEQNIHVLCNMKSYECHLMKIIKG